MPRLPELDPAKFSPEQKKVHDAILAGPRGKVVGPLKVWLNNPGLAEHAQALGAYARFNSSLPPRLSELAICVTGAFWKANFEWYAHAPMAIKAGIDPFAIEVITRRRVSDATFERAKKELGLTSVIDLVGVIGYYSLVSVTLNAFEIPLPDG